MTEYIFLNGSAFNSSDKHLQYNLTISQFYLNFFKEPLYYFPYCQTILFNHQQCMSFNLSISLLKLFSDILKYENQLCFPSDQSVILYICLLADDKPSLETCLFKSVGHFRSSYLDFPVDFNNPKYTKTVFLIKHVTLNNVPCVLKEDMQYSANGVWEVLYLKSGITQVISLDLLSIIVHRVQMPLLLCYYRPLSPVVLVSISYSQVL